MGAGPELSHATAKTSPAANTTVLLPAGALLVTSAALFWGTGLRPHWWLAWLAPLPVLLISPRTAGGRAFWMGAAAWFLGSLNMWFYLLTAISVPFPLVLLSSAVPGCLFGLAVLLFRRLVLRGNLWAAALSVPAFWVTFQYVSSAISPHGTFGNPAYTQMDFLPVLQVASVTGIWGITFCLFLLPATIATVLNLPGTAWQKRTLTITVAGFLALIIGWGYWRVVSAPPPAHSVNVGLIATGMNSAFPHDDATGLILFQDYAGNAAGLAAQGAQVILLPEKIALISDQAAARVDALYAATSARVGAAIVAGLERGTQTKRLNEARLYSPAGGVAATYDKQHLVPGFEDADRPGAAITVIEQPSGTWGIQICKDMDFPALSRRYGARGVGLLLVPAWDFTIDGWLHSRMAVLRGVESGFTVVRAARDGMLTVSDDRGRILAQRDAASVRSASLIATAAVRHDHTLYVRWGDWFAWLNAAGFTALLLSVVLSRFRADRRSLGN